MFPRHLPDALGIAETGSAAVFQELLDEFGDEYDSIWVEPSRENVAGIGLAFRRGVISAKEVAVFPTREQIMEDGPRPRYLIAELTVDASAIQLLVVIAHFKSNRGDPKDNIDDRVDTARRLRDMLLDRSTGIEQPVIVMGDFNAEPFDRIFDQQRLRGHRSFSTMGSWQSASAEFYNPCWRFLPHQAFYPDAVRVGFLEDRPQTSLATSVGVFDQMLFSKSLMVHPRIIFRDKDIRLFYDDLNSRHVGMTALLLRLRPPSHPPRGFPIVPPGKGSSLGGEE